MPHLRDAVLDDVLRYVRGELTTRNLWRRRSWLGRRMAFRIVEATILRKYLTNGADRIDDEGRHAFVERILDALELVGALDIVGAGRYAEERFDDPTDATRRLELAQLRLGQEYPGPIAEGDQAVRDLLNRRRGR